MIDSPNGWVKVPRWLFADDFAKASRPVSKAMAFIDLVQLARFKPGTTTIRGIKIQLERGQLAWSQKALADRWGWSRNKVARYLNGLAGNGKNPWTRNGIEMEQQIALQTSNEITVITVKNYDGKNETKSKWLRQEKHWS